MADDAQLQIAELLRDMEQLKSRVSSIERADTQNPFSSLNPINRNLGGTEKKVLEDVMDDSFLRVFWDKFYYYNTFFEGIDGFNITNSATISGGGCLVESPGTGVAFSDINVDVSAFLGGLSFAKESRFRTVARFSTSTNQDIFMAIGNPTVANQDAYGFFCDDSTLKGFAQTAPGTRTTINLMTISTGVNYTLDARFFPGNKVEFFVNDVPLGSVSATLPATAGTVIWNVHVLESEAVSKAVFIGSIEYLQKKL